MTNRMAVRLAALMGFLAVALGAFGAHGLEKTLTQYNTNEIWRTAVFYHFIHTLMLFLLARQKPVPSGPWLAFFIGIGIFSGSLYVMAVTNARWLGAITPIGGVSLLVGWLWLMITAGGRHNDGKL